MAVDDHSARSKWIRFAALVLAVVVGVVVAVVLWWEQEPTEDELRAAAGLTGKTHLVVGVKTDMPGIGYHDEATGVTSGFEIEIAYLVAAGLGFDRAEVKLLEIENEDRSKMRAATGDPVDLVIATYSATPEREAVDGVSFSVPYLETEQSVVTRKDHPRVLAMTELRGQKVCTLTTSTSVSATEQAEVEIVYDQTIAACVDKLRRGTVDAVTTDAAILGGFVQRYPDDLTHHDIALEAKELWAVNTGGNEPLRTLVNLALHRSRYAPDNDGWERAYDQYLQPMTRHSPTQLVPVRQQPEVPEVEVRQWPWEKLPR